MSGMCRRLIIFTICVMVVATLLFTASAILAEGTSVSVQVTVARTIHVQNGSAGNSNVPVRTQMVGDLLTFVSP